VKKKSPVEFSVTLAPPAFSRAKRQGKRKDQKLLFGQVPYKTVLVDEAWFSDGTRRFGDDDILIA